MIKKITQNSIKTIVCSCIMAFTFLFSLTINSQEVGDEFLVNPGINSTTATLQHLIQVLMVLVICLANLGGWTDGYWWRLCTY